LFSVESHPLLPRHGGFAPAQNFSNHTAYCATLKKYISLHIDQFQLRSGKEIKRLRGGVHRYAAQVTPQIDVTMAGKDRFRMETIGFQFGHEDFSVLASNPAD